MCWGCNWWVQYVGLRPKLYSILRADKKIIKKAKGVKEYVVKKHINFENYKDALFSKKKQTHKMNMLRSIKHQIYGITVDKVTLSPFYSKRYIREDGITTDAHGFYKNLWIWVSAGTISNSSLTNPLWGAGAFK